jgi:hypothetical protein
MSYSQQGNVKKKTPIFRHIYAIQGTIVWESISLRTVLVVQTRIESGSGKEKIGYEWTKLLRPS